jgi:hypothetical protein
LACRSGTRGDGIVVAMAGCLCPCLGEEAQGVRKGDGGKRRESNCGRKLGMRRAGRIPYKGWVGEVGTAAAWHGVHGMTCIRHIQYVQLRGRIGRGLDT